MRPTIPNVGWSRRALEPVHLCPACGSAKRDARQYSRHDDGGVMPDVWRMVRCGDCRSLYLDPRPAAESLPRAYLDYYTHQAEHEDVPEGGAGGLVWSLVHGYLNWRFGMRRTPSNKFGALVFSAIEPLRLKLDYYGRHLARAQFPQPGRLLDVGCGNGAFLLRAREMGWNVAGCEPDAKAVSACQAQGLDVIRGDVFSSALDGELFDVVTISHVLEHVTDPQALLKRAKALMNPGGVLWVAIPNTRSLGLRVFREAWINLHFPFHLCIPSPECLLGWINAAGFKSARRVRRGAHARFHWSKSFPIAQRESVTVPSTLGLSACRAIDDLLASLTARWAEEIVMIAHKPETSDAG